MFNDKCPHPLCSKDAREGRARVEKTSPHKHTPFKSDQHINAAFTNSMSTHVWMFVCVWWSMLRPPGEQRVSVPPHSPMEGIHLLQPAWHREGKEQQGGKGRQRDRRGSFSQVQWVCVLLPQSDVKHTHPSWHHIQRLAIEPCLSPSGSIFLPS